MRPQPVLLVLLCCQCIFYHIHAKPGAKIGRPPLQQPRARGESLFFKGGAHRIHSCGRHVTAALTCLVIITSTVPFTTGSKAATAEDPDMRPHGSRISPTKATSLDCINSPQIAAKTLGALVSLHRDLSFFLQVATLPSCIAQ